MPIPTDPAERAKRFKKVCGQRATGYAAIADEYREKMIELCGEEKGKAAKYAEAFELFEYGRRPGTEELKRLFLIEEE